MSTAQSHQPGAAAAATVPVPKDDRATSPASRLTVWLRTRAGWVFLLDVALVALFTFTSANHVFWSVANTQSLLLSMTEGLLLALGLSMMLGAGIFDLSLGANLVLSGVVGAKVMLSFERVSGNPASYQHVWLAIVLGLLACLATGIVYGLVNGVLIAIAEVNSLIATLATLGIGTGTAYLLTQGVDLGGLPVALQSDIGLHTFGVLPLPAIAAVLLTFVFWGVVRYTRFGSRVQAIGSSRAAAERAGLRVRFHLITLTTIGGALAGLAGFIDLSRFASTAISGHANDALAAVTAVVIGGTLLEGGYISIIGTVWGAALAVILEVGLVLTGVSSFWQLIVVGVVLLFAVVLDRASARRRERSLR